MNKGKVENADMDIFYWHLISQFWAIKGGVNYFYRPAERLIGNLESVLKD